MAEEIVYAGLFLFSLSLTYVSVPWFIQRLREAKITGKDMNKKNKPDVPEMGGLAVLVGFVCCVVLAISITTYSQEIINLNLERIYAVLSTVLIIALIGILDDLLLLNQKVKAILPIFAALPLVALRVGVTEMTFPWIGSIPLGPVYYLVLIPLAITGASNAMNMLAGFNGLEAGLGAIMCATVAAASWFTGGTEALVISVAMLGALIGFMRYNWYPAKILIGDVGTLSIGAVVASTVIIGNIERVGVILIIPFFLELALKAKSRFKAESWYKVKENNLVCEKWCEVYGWGRLIMKLTGGVTECRLVLIILGVEAVFAALAIWSVIG